MVWSHACERPFPSRKKQKEQKTKRELHFSPCDLVVLINVSKLREVWPSVLLDGSTKTDNPYSSLSDISQSPGSTRTLSSVGKATRLSFQAASGSDFFSGNTDICSLVKSAEHTSSPAIYGM